MKKLIEQYQNLTFEEGYNLYESTEYLYTEEEQLEILTAINHQRFVEDLKANIIPTAEELFTNLYEAGELENIKRRE